jgi:hypothetical protein
MIGKIWQKAAVFWLFTNKFIPDVTVSRQSDMKKKAHAVILKDSGSQDSIWFWACLTDSIR